MISIKMLRMQFILSSSRARPAERTAQAAAECSTSYPGLRPETIMRGYLVPALARKNRLRQPSGSHAQAFAASPVLLHLSNKTRKELANCAQDIIAPRGSVFFAAGDRPFDVYFLLAGSVKLVLPAPNGDRERVVALLQPGEMFDLSATFLEKPYVVSAIAVTRCRVARVPKEQFVHAMQREPGFAYAVTQSLSRRTNELLVEAGRTPGSGIGIHRFVAFLVRELPPAARTGRITTTLSASKRAIASRLHLTPEHLSRVLKRLSSLRLISVDGPRITIHDVEKLRRFSDTDAIAHDRRQRRRDERHASH